MTKAREGAEEWLARRRRTRLDWCEIKRSSLERKSQSVAAAEIWALADASRAATDVDAESQLLRLHAWLQRRSDSGFASDVALVACSCSRASSEWHRRLESLEEEFISRCQAVRVTRQEKEAVERTQKLEAWCAARCGSSESAPRATVLERHAANRDLRIEELKQKIRMLSSFTDSPTGSECR